MAHELGAYEGAPWRVVEAQHVVSTRKLVDSDAEQQILEELVERGKPPIPAVDGFEGLHFLLFSSFRYPPLRHGSRFATRWEPSLWYGAEELRTAFAEVAYYRLVFLEGTRAKLAPLMVELSAFQARVRTRKAADLTRAAARRLEALRSKVSYEATQALGRELRDAGCEAVRYLSARDADGGVNLALFTPRAFAEKRPRPPQTWLCVATALGVEVRRKDYFVRESFAFARAQFEVDGAIPHPAR
ncbi:MAG TPA: RES family NAD+ phosphorylase [Vulgatibacter sp.]